MVGSSDEPNYLPTSRQALDRTPLLFPMVLFTILLASVAAGAVSARESAACDQYGCTEESAACDQYGCTSDPAPEEPAPVGRVGPTGVGTPAVEPAPQIESVAPAQEDVSVVVPSAVYQGGEGNAPASEQYADEHEIVPPPEPDPLASEVEPVGTEVESDPRSKSGGQSTNVRRSGSESEIGNGDSSDEQTTEPLPGYRYEGKSCEESNCGLEEIEAPVECAVYETASGEEVYGCSNPNTYEKKGCFEVTFYTAEGKPYSNLDTCSGEKPYAPPEPPEGDFEYWAPPEDKRGRLDPYEYWSISDHEKGECRNDRGSVQWYCGLDVPKAWICGVFYDTTHGTIRGCFDQKDYVSGACYSVRLFDEVGKHIGVNQYCFGTREELCGEDQCGLERKVPARFECSRVENFYWGNLYGSGSRVAIWCEDRVLLEKLKSGGWSDHSKTCAIIFDEDGRRILRMPCTPQGNAHVGKNAGKDAKNAEKTLDGHHEPIPLTDGSNSPKNGAWGPGYFGIERVPEEQTNPVRDADSSTPGRSGAEIPLSTNISDPSVAAPDENADGADTIPGSSSADSRTVDSGSPGTDKSLIPDSADGEASDVWNSPFDSSAYPSRGDEAGVLKIERDASEENSGRTKDGSGASAPSRNASAGSDGGAQDEMNKDASWPEVVYGIRDAVASLPRIDGVGGWLGSATPLAGLGAVAGVFALRRRFLR